MLGIAQPGAGFCLTRTLVRELPVRRRAWRVLAGPSSFDHLRELPVDAVRIEGRFVRELDASPLDAGVVRAIKEVARASGVRVVAEYVGNDRSLAVLRSFGVDRAPGFHIGAPRPPVECLPRVDRAS